MILWLIYTGIIVYNNLGQVKVVLWDSSIDLYM